MASTPGFVPASAKVVQISSRSRSGNKTSTMRSLFPVFEIIYTNILLGTT